jgi:branched-subunit amino acid transport protein AzlD
MTVAWITVGLLTVGTVAIKAAGPIALGGRDMPPQLAGVVARLAPSLLAALVVVDTLGGDRTLVVDETAVGLVAAAAALLAKLPVFAVVVIAAVATATARALV